MIGRLVLDHAPDTDGLTTRLRGIGHPPAVATAGDGPDTLWVTSDPAHAREAISRGSQAWIVGPTGELSQWSDLPLAIAFANGTLADVRKIVGEAVAEDGSVLKGLSWTPDGAAKGEADQDGRSILVFVTAGPAGENPQIYRGADAELMARERSVFVRTLIDNRQMGGSNPVPGQTHTLDAADSPRPRLERERFY